jgi:ketopantoate reductase
MSLASRNSNTFHVIWGSGALGSLLAWDLGQTPSQEFLLVGRSAAAEVPLVHVSEAVHRFEAARARYYSSNSKGILSQLTGASSIVIYFCVPPQETDAAIANMQSELHSLRPKQLVFVFCQNGLVETEQWLTLTHTFQEGVEVSIVRAMVYVGAQRIRDSETTHIHHRGGNLIRYDSLIGKTPAGLFPPRTTLFRWVLEENIRSSELAKFFINIVLFVECRNQNLTNGEILRALPPSRLEALTHAFAGVVATSQVLPEQLVAAFQETTSATAANINSVSFAWKKNDCAIWNHFKRTLIALMESSPNALAATELMRLLEASPAWNVGN